MKQKLALVNFNLMLVVLFTMLFQSVHIQRHLVADVFEITQLKEHKHDGFSDHQMEHDCSICAFSFWYYIEPPVFNYRLYFPLQSVPYLFKDVAEVTCFSGALFSLRGPPVVV